MRPGGWRAPRRRSAPPRPAARAPQADRRAGSRQPRPAPRRCRCGRESRAGCRQDCSCVAFPHGVCRALPAGPRRKMQDRRRAMRARRIGEPPAIVEDARGERLAEQAGSLSCDRLTAARGIRVPGSGRISGVLCRNCAGRAAVRLAGGHRLLPGGDRAALQRLFRSVRKPERIQPRWCGRPLLVVPCPLGAAYLTLRRTRTLPTRL